VNYQKEQYRFSRWCKYFIQDNTIAFWHSISLAVVFLPRVIGKKILPLFRLAKPIDEIIAEIGDREMALLKREELLVLRENDDFSFLRETRERLKKEETLEIIYLLLSDRCNLSCAYCFEDSPTKSAQFKPTLMSKEVAKKAIDLFASLIAKYGKTEKKKIVHLYGGEPLLNYRVVRFVIGYIEKLKQKKILPLECETVIVTNGTLLNEEMAKFFAKHRVTVGVSLDGPQEINDIYRVTRGERRGSYQKAVAAYKLLKKHRVTTGLSATLTPIVIQNFDCVLDFFINELGIQDGISFNILHYNPAVPVDSKYYKKAAESLIKAFKRFRNLGIYEERMMRKVKAFVNQRPMYADCSVVGNQLVIAPDGQIGICQDFVKPRTYFKGSVFESNYDPFERGLFVDWEYRSPFYMEQCFECEALGICGGGCPASAELKTGSRWNIDERICFHSKLTLKWLIWETFLKLNSGV